MGPMVPKLRETERQAESEAPVVQGKSVDGGFSESVQLFLGFLK